LQMATQANQNAEKSNLATQDDLVPELVDINNLVESYLK
jgi:hypothetical protein